MFSTINERCYISVKKTLLSVIIDPLSDLYFKSAEIISVVLKCGGYFYVLGSFLLPGFLKM